VGRLLTLAASDSHVRFFNSLVESLATYAPMIVTGADSVPFYGALHSNA